jgi:hypothetical protein
MLKKLYIGLLVLLAIGFAVFVGYTIVFFAALGAFDRDYSISDLKENFEEHKTEIYELKNYFNKIVPENKFIEIEFSNETTVKIIGIRTLDFTAGDYKKPMFVRRDLDIHSQQMDSIINPLGWTRNTLITLKEKLDKANCIQIESGEPAKIGFKRSGMGMYFFNVFETPIPDSLRAKYDSSCTYILVSDKLVLEYGAGVLGSQCFPL